MENLQGQDAGLPSHPGAPEAHARLPAAAASDVDHAPGGEGLPTKIYLLGPKSKLPVTWNGYKGSIQVKITRYMKRLQGQPLPRIPPR